MRFRGRPWLGGLSGLFLGIGVAVLLQQFAVRPLDNLSFFGLPGAGVVLGLLLAAWAPLGRRRAAPTVVPAPTVAPTPTVAPAPTAPTEPPPPPAPAPPPPPGG